MGMGGVGAYGAMGAQDALDKLREQVMLREKEKLAQEQQQFQNQITTAAGARADRSLDQNDAFRRDQLAETMRQNVRTDEDRTAAAQDRRIGLANTLGDQIPAGTEIGMTDPAVGLFQGGGRGSLLQPTPGHLASTETTSGDLPMPDAKPTLRGSLRVRSIDAKPDHYVKQASEKQQDTSIDNVRQATSDAQRRAHELAMEAIAQQNANKPTGQGADASRMDRSYQASATQLEALRKPVADQIERIARFRDSINQQTPQADSVLAPEVMIIMAGGAGSGVRITQGEIERVTGGRSNLESLKAALKKWSFDPSKALSVTPAQRQQMRQLVSAIAERGQQKLDAVTHAHDALIDAPDVTSHRRIVQDARKAFDAITSAVPANPQPSPAQPSGFRVVGSRPAGGP